jgi:hypothetical protein
MNATKYEAGPGTDTVGCTLLAFLLFSVFGGALLF